jgi:hypothetical protein
MDSAYDGRVALSLFAQSSSEGLIDRRKVFAPELAIRALGTGLWLHRFHAYAKTVRSDDGTPR